MHFHETTLYITKSQTLILYSGGIWPRTCLYLDVSFDGVTHPILEVLPRCLQVPRNDEGQIKGHTTHYSNHDKGISLCSAVSCLLRVLHCIPWNTCSNLSAMSHLNHLALNQPPISNV